VKLHEGYSGIMEPVTVSQICRATGGRVVSRGHVSHFVTGISIDSRSTKPGDCFFALRGRSKDGHLFIQDAGARGAHAIICKRFVRKPNNNDVHVILVNDTLKALQKLAKWYRARYPVTVIGVTGSNGKTTTKEMLTSILQCALGRQSVVSSPGNYNSQIGLPLSVFGLNRKTKAAVFEMAADNRGQIRQLASIARPKYGIVTGCDPAHLQFFGNINNIIQGKLELVSSLPANGKAIINGDNKELGARARTLTKRALFFGLGDNLSVHPENIRKTPSGLSVTIKLPGKNGTRKSQGSSITVQVRAYGDGYVRDVLAAASAAKIMEVSNDCIRRGLAGWRLSPYHFKMHKINGATLLDDSYNANPVSMELSIHAVIDHFSRCRHILVLGPMLELGHSSRFWHRRIGTQVASLPVDALIVVSKTAAPIADAAVERGFDRNQCFWYKECRPAARRLKKLIKPGDVVLVKGSRAAHLEQVIKYM